MLFLSKSVEVGTWEHMCEEEPVAQLSWSSRTLKEGARHEGRQGPRSPGPTEFKEESRWFRRQNKGDGGCERCCANKPVRYPGGGEGVRFALGNPSPHSHPLRADPRGATDSGERVWLETRWLWVKSSPAS